MESKRYPLMLLERRMEAFNRISMESKLGNVEELNRILNAPFNRTSMESKHDDSNLVNILRVTFNRTSMESKHCRPSQRSERQPDF